MNRHIDKAILKRLSKAQWQLAKKHGTPAEFAQAVYRNVPGTISMDEASAAVGKYNREWINASDCYLSRTDKDRDDTGARAFAVICGPAQS